MAKRMLIDDTRQEETRVVVLDGNKLEDVEFESENRKQIKGNLYLAKVVRIEPSLQAAFVDYGGNKHGFLAFGEIHPDYYNLDQETIDAVEKEVDEIVEAKKQQIKERELRREQARQQRAAEYAARMAAEALAKEAEAQASAPSEEIPSETVINNESENASSESEISAEQTEEQTEEQTKEEAQKVRRHPRKISARRSKKEAVNKKAEEEASETIEALLADDENVTEITDDKNEKTTPQKRHYRGRKKKVENSEADDLKVLSETAIIDEESVCETISDGDKYDDDQIDAIEDDDDNDELEYDFELQKKLMKLRKLYYNSTIQDVIKEGQILLVQVVKEERGNKGAALTTYISLAGKYCVLMPNRIKSGGVSRKITNASDRKRLKEIMKGLPISSDMSMIIRTAGEEKTKQDIVRDYNYLIRTWNQIRMTSLKTKAPALIHEEGNLIKRALRDMCTKDVSEVLIDGEKAYQTARDFVRIYSPNQLKKVKCSRKGDIPLFQRFQVENQLDKLHNPIVQLESGGYLVINPTEALVSIDVNSGRATKEKDIEETALNTNLEAADEIARQLRMRNLAGLVVVDFIDMEEPQNNHAVEKRMKEAMKLDRARVQIARMSCFGLLEISRQRMHSSFIESNYVACPHCHGIGLVRTLESAGLYILREIEEEGIKNKFSRLNVSVPSETALYLLNQKKKALCDLEEKYGMDIVICADDSIKNVADFKLERIKAIKPKVEEEPKPVNAPEEEIETIESSDEPANEEGKYYPSSRRRNRRRRFDRGRNRFHRGKRDNGDENNSMIEQKTEEKAVEEQPKRKTGWWRRLIGGE